MVFIDGCVLCFGVVYILLRCCVYLMLFHFPLRIYFRSVCCFVSFACWVMSSCLSLMRNVLALVFLYRIFALVFLGVFFVHFWFAYLSVSVLGIVFCYVFCMYFCGRGLLVFLFVWGGFSGLAFLLY